MKPSLFGNKKQSVYFIGIGGIGMSALAEILISMGYLVSGSDLSFNENIKRLLSLGIIFNQNHHKENIKDFDLVIYTPAISKTNEEYLRAKELNIPLLKRGELLSILMSSKMGIAVAGTHGKTTTTSFLTSIFNHANIDLSYAVGGVLKNTHKNANWGKGDYFLAEADESDGSFLLLNPEVSIITNIDSDHMDYFLDFDRVVQAFSAFSNQTKRKVFLPAHNKETPVIIKNLKIPYETFGIEGKESFISKIDYLAKNFKSNLTETTFEIYHQNKMTEVSLKMLGEHNVLNALGAFAVSSEFIKDAKIISAGLSSFSGVERRLDILFQDKLTIVDDYGHHPTEIKEILKTLRTLGKKLKIIFEPHRFTRTRDFWNDFVVALFQDDVYLLPIYPASEEEIQGINSNRLVSSINEKGGNAHFFNNYDEMNELFKKYREDEDCVILTLGAGPISYKAREFIKEL